MVLSLGGGACSKMLLVVFWSFLGDCCQLCEPKTSKSSGQLGHVALPKDQTAAGLPDLSRWAP